MKNGIMSETATPAEELLRLQIDAIKRGCSETALAIHREIMRRCIAAQNLRTANLRALRPASAYPDHPLSIRGAATAIAASL